jgi:exonuclease SbcC
MKLRSLSIQNFRSYGDAPTKIDLDDGILLFEGDIGSGKSSILYAIEFALFGLGELEARSVLRGSSSTGKVELEFVVGAGEYKVTRTIERKKGVRTTTIQTRGWIEEPSGKRTELSPTELRSRILQILNFKEKASAKASSRIYRYAVFTPQELMKEVLSQRPEDRLDTLRRAFGVEDYSFASSNSEIVIGRLERQISVYSSLSANLPQRQIELEERRKELVSEEKKLAEEERTLRQMEKELESSRDLLQELDSEVKRIRELQATVPLLEQNISRIRASLSELKSDLERNSRLLDEIREAEGKLTSLKSEYERYLSLREKLRELEAVAKEMRDIESEISKLKETMISKEAKIKAERDYKEEEAKKIRTKIESYENEISKLDSIKNKALALREKADSLSKLQNQVEALRSDIGSTRALLDSRKSMIKEKQEKIKALDGISKESKCPLCGQTLSEDHLRQVDSEFQAEIQSLIKDERNFGSSLSKLSIELDALENERNLGRRAQQELENLEHEIARIEQLESLLFTSRKELAQNENDIQKIRAALIAQDYYQDTKRTLETKIIRKEALSKSLADYDETRISYQRLEDSGVPESYQNALSIVSKKNDVAEQISRLEKRSKELEHEIRNSSRELAEKRGELEQGEPIILEYAKMKDEVIVLESKINECRPRFEVLSEKVRQGRENEKRLTEEVEALNQKAEMVTKSSDLKSWIGENFVPAIKDIERHVLAAINEEFERILQRIFSILAVEEGDLSVSIDDNFTPIIEQSGYELEIQSLSGGERTALALAYRLALNYMVKRANEALQANLLILDEPTEGFSKEQIYRFRNALEELASEQVIIVSHERDLEPMADRVFRLEKVNGESVVTLVST